MEYALRVWVGCWEEGIKEVLILVLMEYALWGRCKNIICSRKNGLNPYSNGIYSISTTMKIINVVAFES